MSEPLLKEILGELKGVKQNVNNINQEINSLKKDVGELKQDVSSLKQDVDGLKQDVSSLNQDVDGLKQDVSSLKQDVDGLKQDGNKLNQETTLIRSQITENTEITQAIYNRQEETDAQLEGLVKDFHHSQGEIKSIKKTVDEEMATNKDLKYYDEKIGEHGREIFKIKNA